MSTACWAPQLLQTTVPRAISQQQASVHYGLVQAVQNSRVQTIDMGQRRRCRLLLIRTCVLRHCFSTQDTASSSTTEC
jgi:hypothetical protein